MGWTDDVKGWFEEDVKNWFTDDLPNGFNDFFDGEDEKCVSRKEQLIALLWADEKKIMKSVDWSIDHLTKERIKARLSGDQKEVDKITEFILAAQYEKKRLLKELDRLRSLSVELLEGEVIEFFHNINNRAAEGIKERMKEMSKK